MGSVDADLVAALRRGHGRRGSAPRCRRPARTGGRPGSRGRRSRPGRPGRPGARPAPTAAAARRSTPRSRSSGSGTGAGREHRDVRLAACVPSAQAQPDARPRVGPPLDVHDEPVSHRAAVPPRAGRAAPRIDTAASTGPASSTCQTAGRPSGTQAGQEAPDVAGGRRPRARRPRLAQRGAAPPSSSRRRRARADRGAGARCVPVSRLEPAPSPRRCAGPAAPGRASGWVEPPQPGRARGRRQRVRRPRSGRSA